MKKKEIVVITTSGKCSWGRCIFCPFGWKESRKKSCEELEKEVREKVERVSDAEVLKFFNSGSFLDENQIPKEFRTKMIDIAAETGIREVVVEVLPQHVVMKEKEVVELLNYAKEKGVEVSFAIGLEVADDKIMAKINKPFRTKEFVEASKIIRKFGGRVRAYIMVNLPFVEDQAGMLAKSLLFCKEHADSIAILNTYARPNTELFRLWLEGRWHPLSKKEFEEIVRKALKQTGMKMEDVELYYYDYVCPPRIPKKDRVFLKGVGKENLVHPYFNVWHDYIVKVYQPPSIKKYALFLPCASRKPYSKSKTHRAIISRLMRLKDYAKIHQIMISNAGVIPREFENEYPFTSYDWEEWRETEEIQKEYYEVTRERLENYLREKKKRYKVFFAYLKPDSLSYKALMDAAKNVGVRVVDCVDHKLYKKLKDEGRKDVLIHQDLLDEMVRIIEKELKKHE